MVLDVPRFVKVDGIGDCMAHTLIIKRASPGAEPREVDGTGFSFGNRRANATNYVTDEVMSWGRGYSDMMFTIEVDGEVRLHGCTYDGTHIGYLSEERL